MITEAIEFLAKFAAHQLENGEAKDSLRLDEVPGGGKKYAQFVVAKDYHEGMPIAKITTGNGSEYYLYHIMF